MDPIVKLVLVSVVSGGIGAGIGASIVTVQLHQQQSEFERRLLVEMNKADASSKALLEAMKKNPHSNYLRPDAENILQGKKK